MNIEILQRPACAVARIQLDNGERFTAETGSMVAMSTGLHVETSTRSRGQTGLLAGLKRMLAGENFFLNHYAATRDGEELFLAPTLPGDIETIELRGTRIVVESGGWLGSGPDVGLELAFQGFGAGLLGGEGFFWVKCGGTGPVVLSSFGSLYRVDVAGEYVVDTGHVVAFEESLQMSIGKAGQSLLGSFLGGEGLVCRFRGQGALWCQSHNPQSFGRALGPSLTPRKA
jgi:uncharacterized protein (TIGR00266 family)